MNTIVIDKDWSILDGVLLHNVCIYDLTTVRFVTLQNSTRTEKIRAACNCNYPMISNELAERALFITESMKHEP